jgi:serine/threonine protein kinase
MHYISLIPTNSLYLFIFSCRGHIAPEFFCGGITFKSDMYSLGVMIIEIVTGQKMYHEDFDVRIIDHSFFLAALVPNIII